MALERAGTAQKTCCILLDDRKVLRHGVQCVFEL